MAKKIQSKPAGTSKPPLERTIVAEGISYLNSIPECYARKTLGGELQAGWLDVVACYRGKTLMLECKRPGSKLTRLQEAEMKRWRKAGAISEVFTCREDLIEIIAAVDKEADQR